VQRAALIVVGTRVCSGETMKSSVVTHETAIPDDVPTMRASVCHSRVRFVAGCQNVGVCALQARACRLNKVCMFVLDKHKWGRCWSLARRLNSSDLIMRRHMPARPDDFRLRARAHIGAI